MRPRGLLRGVRLSLELLLGRRLPLFAAVDAVVLLTALFSMLLGSEDGEPRELYVWVFLIPSLVLGVPALSGLVEVERRAGCLDLALSTPASEGYFLRRVGAVCAAMILQGWGMLLLGWVYDGRSFPLLTTLLHTAVASLFLGAVVLFWAVRLKTAGGVWLGSMVTLGAMARWFLANPIPWRFGTVYGPYLPGPEEALAWLPSLAVLAAGTVLFFLYARRRLRRPELMIS